MADIAQSINAAHCCHGDSSTTPTNRTGSRPKRPSTREKIAKMVADGAVNYPAYLKLIYTGDSEQEPSSSEDEFSVCAPAAVAPITVLHPNLPEALPHRRHQHSIHESEKLLDDGRETQRTSTDAAGLADYSDFSDYFSIGEDGKRPIVAEYPTDVTITEHKQSVDIETKLHQDLVMIQDEIATLKSMLNTKMARATVVRQLLGITTLTDFRSSLQTFKQSGTFQKTNKAFKTFGAYASKTMGSWRQSVAFKSVEQKVGSLRTSQSMGNLKLRLRGIRLSKSENNVAMANRDDENENADDLSPADSNYSMTSVTSQFADESVTDNEVKQ